MKLYPTFLLIILTSTISLSQDSLVRFHELTFRSDLERKILENHLVKGQVDYFQLSIANGSSLDETAVSQAQERFYNHLGSLEAAKLSSRRNDKKVRFLYDDIHKTFLTKYELQNRFEDIFTRGYYNCVSASMLYALTFEKMQIPYHVIEKPTHVYLVAYPDNERIMVETTTPLNGSLTVSDQFKANYVKMLKDQKLISAQEYTSGNHNVLFDKHYFGEQSNISFTQLAGLQYMNEGIYRMEEEDPLAALQQFEKAYLLYPSERIGYLLMVSTYQTFSNREERDSVHALCLAKLSRHKKYGIKSEMVQGDFARVVQKLLFENGEKEKMAAYYNTLIANIQDTNLKTEIRYIYNYEFGRLFYNQSKYKESLPYLEEVMKLKPNDQDGNGLFLSCMARSFKNVRNSDIMSSLEAYAANFPTLLENAQFTEMMTNVYLIEFASAYDQRNIKQGEKYREIFENFFKTNKEVSYSEQLLGNAYSSAAVYYFRQGLNSKAKAIIQKGLEISPENYELKSRLRMID